MVQAFCAGPVCVCMDIVNITLLFNLCCCPAVGKAGSRRLPLQHDDYMYKQGTSYLCIWSGTNDIAAGGPALFSQSRDTNTPEKAETRVSKITKHWKNTTNHILTGDDLRMT